MISVTELRAGAVFEDSSSAKASEDKQIYLVLSYGHIKMGRGSGTVKVKVKNLKTGATVEKSFSTGAKVQEAQVDRKKVQFLYADETGFHFMDTVDYNQFSLNADQIGDQGRFLKEGMETILRFWGDEPLGVELPRVIDYQVDETGPGERGNSATNVYKPATMENGLTVLVPLFIKVGDQIKVDTRTGAYVERKKENK